jgi:hypothetical protein
MGGAAVSKNLSRIAFSVADKLEQYCIGVAQIRLTGLVCMIGLLRLESSGKVGRRLFIPMIEVEQWLNTSTAKAPQ